MGMLCLSAWAQSDVDALRYSQNDLMYTARSLGSAGATGALGADFSSSLINPAGMALYRNNSFVIGGGMLNAKNQSTYLENATRDNEFSMNVPHFGLVFNNTKYSDRKAATSGWINTNISFGFNRTNSFSDITNYSATNTKTSMLDYFAQRSNGTPVDVLKATDEEMLFGYNYLETMAYESFLIDDVSDEKYAANNNPSDVAVFQKNVISTGGSTNVFNFGLSANYEHKLYLGGGIDVTTVRYKEQNKFSETDQSETLDNWASWTLYRNLLTRGAGIGANLGLIIRPNKSLRFGAALKTPTILNLTDEYNDELNTSYDDGGSLELETVDGNYDYKVITPMRTTLSGAYIFGKQGFISADMEIVDYSTMRLRPVISAFEIANDDIRNKYGSTVNVRIGGEYVYDMFRFRAGIATYGCPLANPTDGNLKRTYFTGGIGIKEVNWALDLAVVQKRGIELLQPYSLEGSKVSHSTNKFTDNSLVITLSTNF